MRSKGEASQYPNLPELSVYGHWRYQQSKDVLRLLMAGVLVTGMLGHAEADNVDHIASAGLNLGRSSADRKGKLIGVELSVLKLTWRESGGAKLWWLGAYTDLVFDLANSETRFGLGPEVGNGFLGIDGGPVIARQNGTWRAGAQIRPVITLGPIAAYARWTILPGGEYRREAGLLLKYPIPLD